MSTIVRFNYIFLGTLLPHLLASAIRIFIALFISLILGVAIGVCCAKVKILDELLTPVVYILYPVPKIAFLPVLMVFFGLGEKPKIILIILITIFQFIISARDSIKKISPQINIFAKSLNLSKWSNLLNFTLPAILPDIFTSLRINIGISIAVLFFSETFATRYGMGHFIMHHWFMANYLDMFSGILALTIFGVFLFKILDMLEAKMCKGR
jgi:NitT/TauT family transport system permease protein